MFKQDSIDILFEFGRSLQDVLADNQRLRIENAKLKKENERYVELFTSVEKQHQQLMESALDFALKSPKEKEQ